MLLHSLPPSPPSPLPPPTAPAAPASSAQGDLDRDLLADRSLREGGGATGEEGEGKGAGRDGEGGQEGGQEGEGGRVENRADRLAETRRQRAPQRGLISREREGEMEGDTSEYGETQRGRVEREGGGLAPRGSGRLSPVNQRVRGAQSAEMVRLRDLGPAQAHLYFPPPLPLPPAPPAPRRTPHTFPSVHSSPWGSPGLTDDEDDGRFGLA